MNAVKNPGVSEVRAELSALREEVDALHRRLVEVEGRVDRLEVKEEVWQEPDAPGDRPVEP